MAAESEVKMKGLLWRPQGSDSVRPPPGCRFTLCSGSWDPASPRRGASRLLVRPARVRDTQWRSWLRENEASTFRARVVSWEKVLSSFPCLRLSVAEGSPGPDRCSPTRSPAPGRLLGLLLLCTPSARFHPVRRCPGGRPDCCSLRVALKGMAPIASMSLAGPEPLSRASAAWCTRVLAQPSRALQLRFQDPNQS